MEGYVSWREACLRVDDAYGAWASESGAGATVAFEQYVAALDREERAADVYAALVRRAEEALSSEHEPAEPLGGRMWGVSWP
jgi:hypothetical protein